MKISVVILYLLLTLAVLPATQQVNPLAGLEFMIGNWTGSGDGPGGSSTGEISIKYILGDRYIQVTNRTVFPPQEKNPGGEVHEDMGVFSYDKNAGNIVFRQFHIEGFVNTYVMKKDEEYMKSLVFETVGVENGPPGLKARIIYEPVDKNTIQQSFELAFPGKEFACYSKGLLKRKTGSE